jgi:hypothetical protein
MRHHRFPRLSLALALALLPSTPAFAQPPQLRAEYADASLKLELAGSYSSFSAFRASDPAGPWQPLATDRTDCLGGCLYQDERVEPGALYYYRLTVTDPAGAARSFGPLAVRVPQDALRASPAQNPSRGTLRFSVHVPPSAGGRRSLGLRIYDSSGRLVRDLGETEVAPGERVRTWDGLDGSGRAPAGGVYFARFSASGLAATARVLRVR